MNEIAFTRKIDPLRLSSLLGEAAQRFSIDSLAECESTNAVLLENAENGAASGRVVVSDRQTAGRGSRGRRWLSSPEESLSFSLLWRFDTGLERLSGLSLAAGVAVARALAACGAAEVGLKWPNDILYEDRKLGGILVELCSVGETASAVIGVGLNLGLPEAPDEHFALPPAALAQILSPLPERHALLAHLLIELAKVCDTFAHGGFTALREDWQGLNAWQDKPVYLMRDGNLECAGFCRGADHDGALRVETAAGLERLLSGELSLRAKGKS